jgi:hypothetical protein
VHIVGLLCCLDDVSAQMHIHGITVDADERPVKYVDIGFEGKGLGTVSDANGMFSLVVPDSLKNEPVTFSHISYFTKRMLPDKINQDQSISLEGKMVELPEISVYPQKISLKQLKKGVGMLGDMEITGLGGSTGIVLNIKKKSLLKQVEFDVKTCTFDSVIIRVNINKVQKNQNDSLSLGDSFLQTPIYATVKKNNKKQTCKIDIEEGITVEKESVYLSLECVEYSGEGEIRFPIQTGSGYMIQEPMGPLEKIQVSVHIGLALWVYYMNPT